MPWEDACEFMKGVGGGAAVRVRLWYSGHVRAGRPIALAKYLDGDHPNVACSMLGRLIRTLGSDCSEGWMICSVIGLSHRLLGPFSTVALLIFAPVRESPSCFECALPASVSAFIGVIRHDDRFAREAHQWIQLMWSQAASWLAVEGAA